MDHPLTISVEPQMHFQLALLSSLVLLAISTLGTVRPPGDAGLTVEGVTRCTKPIVRREWRTLSRREKKAYFSAIHCLASKPNVIPKDKVPGAVSLYDSFVATHLVQFADIHLTGRFLPWHRAYVALVEKTLRKECGYTGAQPYWDWTLDAPPIGNFSKSPLFDPIDGFGGNGPHKELPANFTGIFIPGRTGGGCVQDGPFTNFTVNLGPQTDVSGHPRCLERDFSPLFANQNSQKGFVDYVLSRKDFASMAWAVDGELFSTEIPPVHNIHAGGHFSVGGSLGTMGDPPVAAYEPIFWLHHANIDRVWWSWQIKDPRRRFFDIDGPIVQLDFENKQAGNVTLSTTLDFGYIGDNLPIQNTMDIREGLCYDYDQYY